MSDATPKNDVSLEELQKDRYKMYLASLQNKELNDAVSSLESSIATIKEKILNSGGSSMDEKDEQKKLEAKAAEEAEAAKKAAEEKEHMEKEEAAKKMKEEEDKKKKEEDEKAEAAKKAKEAEEAEAKKVKEEAEAKKVKDDGDADEPKDEHAAKAAEEKKKEEEAKANALALAEAEASKIGKAVMDPAVCSRLGLSEAESALASSCSYADLVRLAASLSLEVAAYKEKEKKAEAAIASAKRMEELNHLGIAFVGEKAEAQQVKVSVMDDKAFASYKEDLMTIKETLGSGNEFKKAKERLGKTSASVDLNPKDLKTEFLSLK